MGRSSDTNYNSDKRETIPYNDESPYFQAEGEDVTDIAFFLGQFNEGDGELSLTEYWSDPKTGFQAETLGPTTGRTVGGAIGEILDNYTDSGYNLSVYESENGGFEVTAGVSQELPRTFFQRLGRISPEVDHSDGGLTVRGNLDISPEELYEGAKVADLDEVRMWPKADSAFRKANGINLR